MCDFEVWSRDVKQAFIQSSFPIDREIYIKPPKKSDLMAMIGQPEDRYRMDLKPIYGLTESPGYWWQTFKNYHVQDLEMRQTSLDPCLFYKKKKESLVGIIATLVDDTLGCGNNSFVKLEQEMSKNFDVKESDNKFPIKFGGLEVEKGPAGFAINQNNYASTFRTLKPNNFTPKEFSRLRGQIGYIANGTRPDVAFNFAYLSQISPEIATREHTK